MKDFDYGKGELAREYFKSDEEHLDFIRANSWHNGFGEFAELFPEIFEAGICIAHSSKAITILSKCMPGIFSWTPEEEKRESLSEIEEYKRRAEAYFRDAMKLINLWGDLPVTEAILEKYNLTETEVKKRYIRFMRKYHERKRGTSKIYHGLRHLSHIEKELKKQAENQSRKRPGLLRKLVGAVA